VIRVSFGYQLIIQTTSAVFYLRNSRKYRIQIFISMSEQVQSQEEFLANFNWHNFEEGIDPVNQENLKEFEELVTKHLFLLIKKK
jgi:hypothetical protein